MIIVIIKNYVVMSLPYFYMQVEVIVAYFSDQYEYVSKAKVTLMLNPKTCFCSYFLIHN